MTAEALLDAADYKKRKNLGIMSEKRKPVLTLLLRKEGKNKSSKVEIFPAELWGYKKFGREVIGRYRLRVSGKWLNDNKGKRVYFTKWEFRDMLFRTPFFKEL